VPKKSGSPSDQARGPVGGGVHQNKTKEARPEPLPKKGYGRKK
jgi:hypothetical protein